MHHEQTWLPMAEMGQSRPKWFVRVRSASPPTPDIGRPARHPFYRVPFEVISLSLSRHAEPIYPGSVAELDGAEADRPVALCFGWMQLPQGDHGLAVALLIERNREAKTGWIVIHVRTVINLDQVRRLDAPKVHSNS